MENPVPLKDIRDAMEMQSDEMTAYLHRPTGQVILISDQAFEAAEEGDDEFEEPEEFAAAQKILNADAEYLPLPGRFEIDEYRMMQHFAESVAEPSAQDALVDTLRGSGAFRRFKDTVYRLGIADDWYSYRDNRYDDLARTWCEVNGVSVDSPHGMRP